MIQRFQISRQWLGYILRPESSQESFPETGHLAYPLCLADRLLGWFKSGIWILAAIGLALFLGQLH